MLNNLLRAILKIGGTFVPPCPNWLITQNLIITLDVRKKIKNLDFISSRLVCKKK